MKITKLVNFILLQIFCFAALGQEIDLKWSNVYSYQDNVVPLRILDIKEDKIYILYGTLSGMLQNYYIAVCNKSTFEIEKRINLKNRFPKSSRLYFHKSAFKNGILYIFLKDINGARTTIFCSKLNLYSEEALVDGKALASMNSDAALFSNTDSHINVFFSDQQRYIVIYANLPNKNKENEKINYTLLDTNLTIVKEKLLVLPYQDKNYSEVKYWVNRDGDLGILGLKRLDKNRDFTPVIFNYDYKNEETNEVDFPLPDGNILNFHLFRSNNEIVYAGTFTPKNTRNVSLYIYRYDEERNIQNSTFTLNLKDQELRTKYWKVYENDLNLYNYDLVNYYETSKDTLIFVLEKQVIHKTGPYGYEVGNLILIKATKTGSVIWMNKIPRSQFLTVYSGWSGEKSPTYIHMTSGLLSYSMLNNRKSTFFIYNDHKDNVDEETSFYLQQTKFKKDGAVYLAQLTDEGAVSRKIIYYSGNEDFYISNHINFNISDKELFALAVNPKKMLYKFIRISIE